MLLMSSLWWKHLQESGARSQSFILSCVWHKASFICFLHMKKIILKIYGRSMCCELSLMTCFFPHQHHYPLPHDYMGSGCAAVCWRSGHALLPIHLHVRLFPVPLAPTSTSHHYPIRRYIKNINIFVYSTVYRDSYSVAVLWSHCLFFCSSVQLRTRPPACYPSLRHHVRTDAARPNSQPHLL